MYLFFLLSSHFPSFHPRLNWHYFFALGCTVKSVFVQTNGRLCILVYKMCVNKLNVSIPMHIPPSSWINTEKNPDGQTRQPKMLFSFLVKKQLTAARWKWIMKANDTGVRQYSSCSVPGRWEKKTHTVWGLNDVSSTRVKTVCSCLICVSSVCDTLYE